MGLGERRLIVVGLGKARHDSSVAASINGKLKYAKYERDVGIKHGIAPESWFYKKLSEWGIENPDLIVETDGGVCSHHGVPRLPWGGEIWYVRRDGIYVLDHHTAHTLSQEVCPQNIVIDGKGSDNHTMMISNQEHCLRSKEFSPGHMFHILGSMMNLKVPDCGDDLDVAGKIMGFASYGTPDLKMVKEIDGANAFEFIQSYLHFGFPCKDAKNVDWQNAVSTVNELCFRLIEKKFDDNFDINLPISYSGGCALNVDWNARLLKKGYQLKIEPHVYDGGLSIGCVNAGCDLLGVPRPIVENFPYIQDDQAPETKPTDETIQKVVELLAKGKIVGWYQGHGEIGPRALGNRSILMRPDLKDGKDIINSKIKHREWWRPFGASVKQDKASDYFDIDNSPYMMYTSQVIQKGLDSITHIDGTCRHQTVTPEQNETFYRLLDAFEEKTGLSVLLNTSLNLGGKPIAGTIAEAIELFQTTEMDALCLGNHLLLK